MKITVITGRERVHVQIPYLFIYSVQGPLCVNENNGYNGPGEKKLQATSKNKYDTNLTNEELKKKKKKKKKKKCQANLRNDGSKEPQEQDDYNTSSSEKKRLILSFCGGAYPKFRE